MTAQGESHFRCPSHLGTVLIGSSLKMDSNTVVRTGAAVADAAGAKMYLVHASPIEPVVVGFEPGGFPPEGFQEEAERRRRLLWDQAERLGIDPDELAGLAVALETPHRVIVETARQIGAGLIVVGASEPGGSLGKLLGSTADRVVRQAICPVLVVRGTLTVPARRVLMPVDLSALSADTFRCGLHLLGQISHSVPAEIEALYALDSQDQLEFLQPEMPWMTTSQQVERRAARELERFVLANCEEAPGPVRTTVRPGNALNEILDELDRKPVDLVILGTHGRSGFDRLLLGSVASAVLRQAPCSVLMIPPAASLGASIAEAALARTAPAWHVEQHCGAGSRSRPALGEQAGHGLCGGY
jgi:nucleotide-binding universal stress UspA family protein